MPKKYYAVQKGRVPGVYDTWDEAKQQIDGFTSAVYKSFKDRSEAEAFLGKDGYDAKAVPAEPVLPQHAYAFVDGSYNPDTGVYGYGGFLVLPGENGVRSEVVLQGHDNDAGKASMRNVAGELDGALAAMHEAASRGLTKLTVFYDYEGIGKWADGQWKTNKDATADYRREVENIRSHGLDVVFEHVDAHTGIAGNERVDALAKEAVGVSAGKKRKLPDIQAMDEMCDMPEFLE